MHESEDETLTLLRLEELPFELIEHVCTFFDFPTLYAASFTCKELDQCVQTILSQRFEIVIDWNTRNLFGCVAGADMLYALSMWNSVSTSPIDFYRGYLSIEKFLTIVFLIRCESQTLACFYDRLFPLLSSYDQLVVGSRRAAENTYSELCRIRRCLDLCTRSEKNPLTAAAVAAITDLGATSAAAGAAAAAERASLDTAFSNAAVDNTAFMNAAEETELAPESHRISAALAAAALRGYCTLLLACPTTDDPQVLPGSKFELEHPSQQHQHQQTPAAAGMAGEGYREGETGEEFLVLVWLSRGQRGTFIYRKIVVTRYGVYQPTPGASSPDGRLLGADGGLEALSFENGWYLSFCFIWRVAFSV